MTLEPFKNFRFEVFYKPIFMLFTIILITSLFVETKAISNEKVQLLSIISIMYSIIAWFVNDSLGIWQRQMNAIRGQIQPLNYVGTLTKITIMNTSMFITYLVLFMYFFTQK